ncbi:MAG: aspartate--tRNA ligase, partial [Acidobacteriota bacterium]
VAGFERYVQIARCFRDEDLRADRQPEFTQIDLEMSFVDEDDVMEMVEGLFAEIFPLAGIDIQVPLPRLTYAEAMSRYGSDRPDLRFGLEITDLTALLGGSGFRGFQAAADSGGVIRGFAVPGAAAASRKQVDAWVEVARRHGAMGALTLRHRDGELQFQVKKTLTEDEMAAAAEALDLQADGLAVLVAGDEATTSKALGALRVHLAKEYDLIPEGEHAFLWVTEFPLVEWDEDSGRWFSLHHPFTSPDPRDLHLLDTDPGKVRSRAYDVVMDGIELGGGSIRIHRSEIQQKVFEVLGISAEEARHRFGFLLDALSYGAPPHGGVALGLDRIIMLMAGAQSIRDVILFPKTASATCLMTEAPSTVDGEQLEELGLSILAETALEGGDGDGA